ncbi:DUF2905 domain-containing protein [Terriglobus saanensis]|uniref:DUF2905 domain-containing protein n=1 Tax=Terriglobus saanensis (strain ATCC BAA-1853 / DSM 23119 / SP1PR4) TaxID=401053 RepID=E8UZ65_TERSS|nr:DUF2905 domain-containing protein [Terriglobus saanensis]ADV82083.1 hypothetical protein AciPR4_1258 [Terriglobus saanensis SP1PR4]
MQDLGRLLLGAGLLLCVLGAAVLLFGRMGVPLGRLPGDMNWRGKGWSVSFPLMTSILFSVVLSLLFYLFGRIRR